MSATDLPAPVKTFIDQLFTHLLCGNAGDVFACYEGEFRSLTDKYYKSEPWPSAEVISELVEGDEAFLMLYKELVYRHLFAKFSPSVAQRVDSWNNYCQLFDGLLEPKENVEFPSDLPPQWCFDLVNEFVYQFQGFCQLRFKLIVGHADEELIQLAQSADMWNKDRVLSCMQRMVTFSQVEGVLAAEQSGSEAPRSPSELVKNLGYFCMVGLARAHTITGNYREALKVLNPVAPVLMSSGDSRECAAADAAADAVAAVAAAASTAAASVGVNAVATRTNASAPCSTAMLYSAVPGCRLSLFYHAAFSLLMLGRYVDAIRVFSHALLHFSRNRIAYVNNPAAELVSKAGDKMVALLALAAAFCPARAVDEQVWALIREKQSDKLPRLLRGEEQAFEELFGFAAPKFVDTAPVSFATADEQAAAQAASRAVQRDAFMTMVRASTALPELRAYLCMYSRLPLAKLATFRGVSEKELRGELDLLSKKSQQVQMSAGAALEEGAKRSAPEVEFTVQGDVVVMAERKPATKEWLGDYFVNHTEMCTEIIAEQERK